MNFGVRYINNPWVVLIKHGPTRMTYTKTFLENWLLVQHIAKIFYNRHINYLHMSHLPKVFYKRFLIDYMCKIQRDNFYERVLNWLYV